MFQDVVMAEVFPNIWKIAICSGQSYYDVQPDGEPSATFSFGYGGNEHSAGSFVEGQYAVIKLPVDYEIIERTETHKSESWHKRRAEDATHEVEGHDCYDERCPGRF
jgi:hypothetical protein